MNNPITLLQISFCMMLLSSSIGEAKIPSSAWNVRPQQGISYTENLGQIVDDRGEPHPEVLYTAGGPGVRLFFTRAGISYLLTQPRNRGRVMAGERPVEQQRGLGYRFDMQLVGSNPQVSVRTESPLVGYSNYYHAHCSGGINRVRSYGRIIYQNIYPSIDLVYYSNEGGMKYDFIIHPGGRVGDIRMRYPGAEHLSIDARGSLHISTPLGAIEEKAPHTYQGSLDRTLPSVYRLSDGTVGFSVGAYDSTRQLVIDPAVSWSTYYGGEGDDTGDDIAVDPGGNVVVMGNTPSTTFPVALGFQMTNAGAYDLFVLKLDRDGERQWATYYGGSADEISFGLDVDSQGSVVVAGNTVSTDFPISNGAQQSAITGAADLFVVKLNGDGLRLWGTYYGGSGDEIAFELATDQLNNIAVTGRTASSDFPTTQGAFQTAHAGGYDAFVVRLNGDGALQWGTFLGGSGDDNAFNICSDIDNNLVMVGVTSSNDFPVSAGAFQAERQGESDAFIVRFSGSGQRLWGTYFGGGGADEALSVTTDTGGGILLCGKTISADFPVSTGAHQSGVAGGTDAFIASFAPGGTQRWTTLYGGTGNDGASAIALDADGNIIVSGSTSSDDFPATLGSIQSARAGSNDLFIVRLGVGGVQQWSSYYGGNGADIPARIDVGGDLIHITGSTESVDFPTTPGAFQNSPAGGASDAFVLEIDGAAVSSVEQGEIMPRAIMLYPVSPNPVTGELHIRFLLATGGVVAVTIYGVDGREVVGRSEIRYEAGQQQRTLGLHAIPSGRYFLELQDEWGGRAVEPFSVVHY